MAIEVTLRLHVSGDSGEPVYRQIARQIRQAVSRGSLKPGERLPAVRFLARQLKRNPNTIARAYRELEHVGLLEARAGAGTCVVGTPSASAGETREPRWKRSSRLRPLAEKLVVEGRRLGLSPAEIRRLVLAALGERRAQ
jgi:GntR family transcriptional regulator